MSRGSHIGRGVVGIDERKLAGRLRRQPDRSSPEDTLNRAIIAMLQEDGRMAYSEIAHALGVSEGTIRNRVGAMKQAGMLRIVAIADPVASAYRTEAMLGLKVAAGHTPQGVAERLAALPQIVYILWLSGRFELLVEVVCGDEDAFLAFLEREICGPDDIAEAETMMGLKNYKNQFLLKSNWESAS